MQKLTTTSLNGRKAELTSKVERELDHNWRATKGTATRTKEKNCGASLDIWMLNVYVYCNVGILFVQELRPTAETATEKGVIKNTHASKFTLGLKKLKGDVLKL